MTTKYVRVEDTPADKAAAAARPIPKEKKLASGYLPCPHCAQGQLVFHCSDKTECSWLRCALCLAIIEPSDWSHAVPKQGIEGHGRTTLRNCAA